MYHIEKGDYVNKYQRYENNPISAFIYKSLGILCISLVVSYDELYLGKLRSNENNMFIGCHGDIILFNRSLTEYEISWVKNNIMCSKQQEPDIDL